MPRYIVRCSAKPFSPEQVAKLRSTQGVKVVDEAPKMLLVDGDEAGIKDAVASFGDVTIHEELSYSVPDPHPSVPKPEKPPAKPPKK